MASAPPPSAPASSASNTSTAVAKDSGLWEKFKEFLLIPVDKGVLYAAPELGHLAPIIFTFGAAFVSLVTLNYPLFIFAASSVEAFLAYQTFSTLGAYTVTPSLEIAGDKKTGKACKSHFQTLTPSRFEAIFSRGLQNEFPNSPLYFISFAIAYCIQSMYFFSKECSELGPQYSNRPYLAMISAAMFVILYSIYLLSFSCESTFTLIMTIILGLFVGYLICYQNFYLFGKNAVDLLFIPALANRSGMDYICVTTNPVVPPAKISYDRGTNKLSLNWNEIPNVSSYTVTYYHTTTPAPVNGTQIGNPKANISPSNLSDSLTVGPPNPYPGAYYYATVKGVMSDGSTTAPVASSTTVQF
jgi:hypothetical protein